MDAISFVLGVKSAQLRSAQLKDLVFRGSTLRADDESSDDDAPDRASVTAVIADEKGVEHKFQRVYVFLIDTESRLRGAPSTATMAASFPTRCTTHASSS